MSTKFIIRGDSVDITDDSNIPVVDKLPPKTYIVRFDEKHEVYSLESVQDMKVEGKIYGSLQKWCDRICTTFRRRTGNTGSLMVGDKGSGKTMLAAMVSQTLRAEGVPTIIINSQYVGDEFNKFMQAIEQECIILFDEFEKTYDDKHQEGVLTLMGGAFASRKLFLLTCNDEFKLDQHLLNRPGRIYYFFRFHGMEELAIQQYCEENLANKAGVPMVIKISKMFRSFNFDMLKTLIEECNANQETPEVAVEWLNMQPDSSSEIYEINIVYKGVELSDRSCNRMERTGSPLLEPVVTIFYRVPKPLADIAKPDLEDPLSYEDYKGQVDVVLEGVPHTYRGVDMTKASIKTSDPVSYNDGVIVLRIDSNTCVRFTRRTTSLYDWKTKLAF